VMFILPVQCPGIGTPTEAMLSVVACGPLLATGVPNHSAYTQRRHFALALLYGLDVA
jgi:hypothetical protein